MDLVTLFGCFHVRDRGLERRAGFDAESRDPRSELHAPIVRPTAGPRVEGPQHIFGNLARELAALFIGELPLGLH